MQQIEAEYDLDLTKFFAKMNLVSDKLGTVEDILVGMRRTDPFAQQASSATKLNQTLGGQAQVYQKIQATAESFRKEQERLKQVYADLKKSQNEYIAAGKYDELTGKLDQVKKRLAELKLGLGEVIEKEEKLNKGGSGKGPGFLSGITGQAGQLAGLIGVSFGVAEALRTTITESAKFGKALSELSAITGVTGKDLEFLADAAVDLETRTGIAAVDIVEGFKLVGSIKPELLGNKQALAETTDAVIALSQASGVSLADAATVAVGALNQFGEGADQANRFVNVLAAGAKLGASEVRDTGEALKTSGTAIKAAGVSFEQGNAIIQSLAGVMIKGSEAGTGLRNVLLKLETASDKNLRPSVVGLDAALENASKKFNTTTELTKVFGVENIVAARRILDTRSEISKMATDLTGTNIAFEQQRTNLDNLSTDLSKAGTATVGFFRNLGQSQDGFLRHVLQGYTAFVQSITAKTGVLKAFFASLFDGKGGITSAFTDAAAQSAANEAARKKAAEVAGIKTGAIQGVSDDTKALADLYIKQGQLVPAAQKAAIQKVKEQRDQEYADAVADHNRIRKEYEKAGKDEQAAYQKQFEASRKRILATQTAKKLADSNLTRQQKAEAERAAALKSALGEGPTNAEKKTAKEQQKIAEDNYKLLLSAQAEYTKEYEKLQADFSKDKLEALKKDANAYLLEKARLDKQAVDAEEAHLLKLLQLASSNKTVVNKATGVREVVANTGVGLPADVKAQFDAKRKEIDSEADRQIKINKIRQQAELIGLERQTNQTELKLFDAYWEERLLKEADNSEKLVALTKKRDDERNALLQDQLIRDQKAQEQISLSNIAARVKTAGQTGTQFMRRNQLDEVATQILSAENQLFGLEQQNDPKNSPEIKRLEAYVKALKDKRKEIELLSPASRDIFDLLGISKNFKDETERQLFLSAIDQISSAISQTTQLIVQQSEEKIQALDAQIQAKTEQVSVEEERDKEGYANNLSLRKQELEDLKKQKAEEEQVKRKALAVQQALDLAAQISNNAVTVSNTVTAISEMFKQYGKIPFVGIFLALGAVATIVATIASVKARAKALTQLRQGGKLTGANHENGGIKGTGRFSDIEVEGGEHVINARDSSRYDKTLLALNQNNPKAAFLALLNEGGIGLPSLIIQHMNGPGFGTSSGIDLSGVEKRLGEHGDLLRVLVAHTKPGKQYVGMGDGTYLEIEGTRKTIQNR